MIFLIVILMVLLTLLLHELIHYVVALSLGYKPKVKYSFFKPAIVYDNQRHHVHNLLIASSAPLVLVLIGLVIKGTDLLSCIFKISCLINCVNLLPITNDGEVILLSLSRMIR